MPAIGVALLTDSDGYAGTESHIYTLAKELQQDAHVHVAVACPPASPLAQRARASNIESIGIEKRGLVDREAVRCLVDLLRSKRIQIIHTHNGRSQLNAAIAVMLAGMGKCIATQHFLDPDHVARRGPRGLAYRQAHRWVNRRTSHFVAVSEVVKQRIVARGEADAGKVTVVPHGIQIPDQESTGSPGRLRAEMSISRSAPLLVCTARLEMEKDVASLITAMSEVVGDFPAATCLIAGDGSQKHALSKQITEANLDNSVRLLGFRADAPALMHAANIFILPSIAESFGLVLLEAMAMAKPVIATCSGGPVEIVVDGQTGLLVPPANPAMLSKAILSLLSDPERARQMGEQGRTRFSAQYTAAQMANSMLGVYKRVREQNSVPRS